MIISGIVAGTTSGLSDEEETAFRFLVREHGNDQFVLDLLSDYYYGNQLIATLGIAIPPQLDRLHTVIGWPQLAVDTLDERLSIEGFRYPGSPDVDSTLADIWQANNMDEEHSLAHIDALSLGRCFLVVGSGTDAPLITVESPRDMSAMWNPQTRQVTAALRPWKVGDTEMVTLYLPNQTIYLRLDDGVWKVEEVDEHNLGVVPVVRMANRPRTHDRAGRSEITSAVMSITDAACRTLLGMEVAREFYGAPQRYILGASESAFQDAQGNSKSAWETYIGRVLALERDDEGQLPEVGQFTPYNPAVYTEIIGMYAEIMSSITGLPPQFLGKTTANPASADAIRSSESRLNKRAERRQTSFENAWEITMRLALMMLDPGRELPSEAHKLETVWAPVETPTPAATTDAVSKQVAGGIVPARSDVLLQKLGYTPVEREIIALEWEEADAEQALNEIIASARAPQEPAAAEDDGDTG